MTMGAVDFFFLRLLRNTTRSKKEDEGECIVDKNLSLLIILIIFALCYFQAPQRYKIYLNEKKNKTKSNSHNKIFIALARDREKN